MDVKRPESSNKFLFSSISLVMELAVAIRLIEMGVAKKTDPQQWADLGAGNGLFTNALSSLLAEGSTLYAIDRDEAALSEIKLPKAITLKTQVADFDNDKFEMPPLHGVLMANSLHYIADKSRFADRLKKMLTPLGRLLLIEYDLDTPNRWVPFPVSKNSLKKFAHESDFASLHFLAEEPSVYHRANLYSAVLWR